MKKTDRTNFPAFKSFFSFLAALLFSVSVAACDSTKEVVSEDADPDVEVSENTVTDIDTSKTVK